MPTAMSGGWKPPAKTTTSAAAKHAPALPAWDPDSQSATTATRGAGVYPLTIPSIHFFIHLSIHLSVCLFCCSSIHLSFCPSFHLSVCPSFYPLIHHLFACQPIHASMHSSIHLSIYPSIHPLHVLTCLWPMLCQHSREWGRRHPVWKCLWNVVPQVLHRCFQITVPEICWQRHSICLPMLLYGPASWKNNSTRVSSVLFHWWSLRA